MAYRKSKFFYLRFLFIPLFIFLFGGVTYLLWNNLMPDIFGLPHINFGQALGLLVLSKLLFGGFGPGRGFKEGRHRWRQKMHEHWASMTEEQREEFRAKRARFGMCTPWEHMHSAQPKAESEGQV